jgi:hypothetical protein
MALRIPLTHDQTLQTEFHEIERRLRKLETAAAKIGTNSSVILGSGGTGSPSLGSVYARLTALEQALAALGAVTVPELGPVGASAQAGIAPDPGLYAAPTGVAEHVLKEDATWGFPFRGLVQVGTSGEQTQPPYDVLNVFGGLQVGDVTAADVELFNLYINGDIEYRDSYWDDLRIEPVARTTGANAPSFEKWYDDVAGTSRGVNLYSFDDAAGGSEKEIFFTMQMPHAWKLGTLIHLHVHWVGAVNDTTADPRWGLEYAFKDIGEVFGDSVIIYSDGTHSNGATNDPDVTAGKHYLTEFPDITPGTTADNVSSILIGRVFRDSANAADTYNAAGAKCGLLYIDAHVELNSPGSRQEYAK